MSEPRVNGGEHYRKGRRYGRSILAEQGAAALVAAVQSGERLLTTPDATAADRHELYGLRSILREEA